MISKMGENQGEKKAKKASELISLSEASRETGYTPEYLNFLSRQGKLQAKKIGRNWHTTWGWLKDFLESSAEKGVAVFEVVEETFSGKNTEEKKEIRAEEKHLEKDVVLENEKKQAEKWESKKVVLGALEEIRIEKRKAAEFKKYSRRAEEDDGKKFSKIFLSFFTLAVSLPILFLAFRFSGKFLENYNFLQKRNNVFSEIPDGEIFNENPVRENSEQVLGEEIENNNFSAISSSENFRVKEMTFGGNIILVKSGDRGNLEISDIRSESFISGKKEQVKLVLSWKTNKMASSEISYSKNNGQNPKTIQEKNFGFNHSVVIADLEPRTSYVYDIKCRDRWGNETVSSYFGIYTASKPVSVFDMISKAVGETFGWAIK